MNRPMIIKNHQNITQELLEINELTIQGKLLRHASISPGFVLCLWIDKTRKQFNHKDKVRSQVEVTSGPIGHESSFPSNMLLV